MFGQKKADIFSGKDKQIFDALSGDFQVEHLRDFIDLLDPDGVPFQKLVYLHKGHSVFGLHVEIKGLGGDGADQPTDRNDQN